MSKPFFDVKDVIKLRDNYKIKFSKCNDLYMKKKITETLLLLEGVINSYRVSYFHLSDKFYLCDLYYDLFEVTETYSGSLNSLPSFYDPIVDIEGVSNVDSIKNYSLSDVVKISKGFFYDFSKSSGISCDFLFKNFTKYHKFSKSKGFGLNGIAYMLGDTDEYCTVSLYDGSLTSVFVLVHELAHCLEFKISSDNSFLYNDRISNEFFAYFINLCLMKYLSNKLYIRDVNSLLSNFHDDYSLMYIDLFIAIDVANIVGKSPNMKSLNLLCESKKTLNLSLKDIIRLSSVGVEDFVNLESIKLAISLFDLYLVDPEKALFYINDYLNSNLVSSEEVSKYMKNAEWLNTNLENYKRTLIKGF